MNMLNVATALNAGSRSAESGKKGKDSGGVTDDFRKLFQGKEDSAGNTTQDSQVSGKDTNQKKDVVRKKDDSQKKDEVQETPGNETADQESNLQAAGLFAAYQLDQSFRPGIIQVEPEAVAVEVEELTEPVEMLQATTGTEQAVDLQLVQTESQAVQTLPTEKAAEGKIQTVTPEETVHAVETPVVSRNEAKASSAGQENRSQTDDRSAEQMVQAPVQQTRTETVQETAPRQETVRMHVPEPEALPEKLTDQIMTKMADGVKEFEIQIEPENLGKISVKISYENGQASVSLLCSEKKALDVLGQNVKDICAVIERNFGGSTTVILEKPENDYLNQYGDENGRGRQNQEQEQQQQKENRQQQSEDDAGQFLQKLRLGLVG